MKTLDEFISKNISTFFSSNLDQSVYDFLNLVYEYITVLEVKNLLLGTELKSLINNIFPPIIEYGEYSKNNNIYVELYEILERSTAVEDMLYFYSGIFTNNGNRDFFDFLKAIWEEHFNIIYKLSGIFFIHILGAFLVKENLC